MNLLDKITLKSFLAALVRQACSLPGDLQQEVNAIAKTLSAKLSHLDLLTEDYPLLEQDYLAARAILQDDGDRLRSSVVEEKPSVEITDEQLLNLASEILSAKDSVSFAKQAYAESPEFRQLLAQLLPQTSSYTINILDLIGKYCITTEAGQRVYDLIHPKLLEEQPVELDFTGVEIAAPPFLNFAIGQLLKDIPPETINRLLPRKNLNPLDEESLEFIIDDCQQYYSDSEFRSRVDQVIYELATAP
ncbi:MAG: STAS-like domain-containing protein [Symploca sp. SIO3E6]|nr:STAS-like domain-containing protein [Caldora sp. SIO3E6]